MSSIKGNNDVIIGPKEFEAYLDKMSSEDWSIDELGSTLTQDYPDHSPKDFDFLNWSLEELYGFLNDPRFSGSYVWTQYKIKLPIGTIYFTVQSMVSLTDDHESFHLVSYNDHEWEGGFVNTPNAAYTLSYKGFAVQDPETSEFLDDEQLVNIIKDYFAEYAIVPRWMCDLGYALSKAKAKEQQAEE